MFKQKNSKFLGGIVARINIEDSLFRDKRFQKLIIKTGNEETALGKLVLAWILAQKYWLKNQCIPTEHWDQDFDVLIEIGLARKIDGGVYLAGSKDQFKWLDQRSNAGRIGGKVTSKRSPSGRLAVDHQVIVGSKPLTLTPTLSLNTKNITNHEYCGVTDSRYMGPSVSTSVKSLWLKIYKSEDFINSVLMKAVLYYESKPENKPKNQKGWERTLSNWLQKDFMEMQHQQNKTLKTAADTIHERNPDNTKQAMAVLKELKK